MPRKYVGRSSGGRSESSAGFLDTYDADGGEMYDPVVLENGKRTHGRTAGEVALEASSSHRRRKSVDVDEESERHLETQPRRTAAGSAPAASGSGHHRNESAPGVLHSSKHTHVRRGSKVAAEPAESVHPMVTRRQSLQPDSASDVTRDVAPTPTTVPAHYYVPPANRLSDVAGGRMNGLSYGGVDRRGSHRFSLDEDDAAAVSVRQSFQTEAEIGFFPNSVPSTPDILSITDHPMAERRASGVATTGADGPGGGPARRRRSSVPTRLSVAPYSVTGSPTRGEARLTPHREVPSPRLTPQQESPSSAREGGGSDGMSLREMLSNKLEAVTSTFKDLEFSNKSKQRPGSRKINPVYTDPRFEAEVLQDQTPRKKGGVVHNGKKLFKALSSTALTGSKAEQAEIPPPSAISTRRRSQSAVACTKRWTGAGPVRTHLLVSVSTWNMNGKAPPGSLDPMLEPNKYHVYVVGTEECEQKANAVRPVSKKKWEQKIEDCLGEDYTKLASKTMQAIHIVCFVRKDVYLRITDVQTASCGTGLGNFYGNKGAVAVSFLFDQTSFLFIGSHLAAHQDEVGARNAHFWKINRELGLVSKEKPVNTEFVTDRFDRVFWMGDLNYRINMTREVADRCLADRDLVHMLAVDQLRAEMEGGRVFVGFREGEINFAPTYKFDVDTDEYDSSEKQRVPSWTDRILTKCAGTASDLVPLGYRAVNELKTSDHRPVNAIFRVGFTPNSSIAEHRTPATTRGAHPREYVATTPVGHAYEDVTSPTSPLAQDVYGPTGAAPHHAVA